MVVFTSKNFLKTAKAIAASYETHREESMVQIKPVVKKRSLHSRFMGVTIFISVLVLLGAASSLACGLMIYRQYMRNNPAHYQGYCTIPIPNKKAAVDEPQLIDSVLKLPLRFSAEPDVHIVSLLAEDRSDDLVDSLREELDIAGNVEKISVFDNGRRVNFTHDFENNFTGIVDEHRCFLMDLDPELVVPPALFVVGIEREEQFEVSPVRSRVRAALPPLSDLSDLIHGLTFFRDNCMRLPIYKLYKDDGIIIRKRSADEPPHDYIQFSGKHVQKIEITNLQDIIQEEGKAKDKRSVS